jgi:uncharacterized integral membrane protein
MNLKQTLKTLFTIAILSLLVVMGMFNTHSTYLYFPRFKEIKLPAAVMYFAFFGVGMLVGTILMVGGGSKKKGKD